jgi:hypothetical protein
MGYNTDGTPKLTRRNELMGKPGYRISDLIGPYWGGSYQVDEVWEVTGEPEESDLEGFSWKDAREAPSSPDKACRSPTWASGR